MDKCITVKKAFDSTTDDSLSSDINENYQVSPQSVVDSFKRYSVRERTFLLLNRNCGLCYNKYIPEDRMICLPCQHSFHDYCIENWLLSVKLSCPIDQKPVIRTKYLREKDENLRKNLLIKMNKCKIKGIRIDEANTYPDICMDSTSAGFEGEGLMVSSMNKKNNSPEIMDNSSEISHTFPSAPGKKRSKNFRESKGCNTPHTENLLPVLEIEKVLLPKTRKEQELADETKNIHEQLTDVPEEKVINSCCMKPKISEKIFNLKVSSEPSK